MNDMPPQRPHLDDSSRGEFASGWRTLAATTIGFAFGMTPMGVTYTLGAFVAPLTEEFGWTRLQIFSVALFSTAAIVPASILAGWLVDRFGARRLILPSQVGFALAFFALGMFTNSLASLYALYFLMPLLAVGTTQVAFSKVVLNHFVARRGLALGIALSGTGICAATMPPLLTWVITHWNWRAGYFAAGLVPLLVALPLSWAWIRERDSTSLQAQPANPPSTSKSKSRAGALGELRSRRFWTLAVAFLLAAGAASGLLTNLVPLLTDRGHSPAAAAGALSLVGASIVIGRLLLGALLDRYWAPLVGMFFLIPAAFALLALLQGSMPWPVVLALLVIVGLATGAELDLCTYIASRYFNENHFGKIYGWLFIAIAVGAATAGPAFGWSFDRFGSYRWALIAASAGYAVCGVMLLSLGPYPSRPLAERPAAREPHDASQATFVK